MIFCQLVVDTYLIAGSGYPTFGQIFDNVFSDSETDVRTIDGDGTVPLLSATYGYANKVYYTKEDHQSVFTGNGLKMAVKLLTDTSPDRTVPVNNYVHTTPFTIDGTVIQLHSPTLLDLYDDQGHHTGSSSAGFIEEGIPGSTYDQLGSMKMIYVPSGGNYHLSTRPISAGSFTLEIIKYENSKPTQRIIYKNVQQTTETKASMSLENNNTTLSVDTNGDGIADQSISPTYNLSGNDALDYAPPFTFIELAPAPDSSGNYTNPVTITLSAVASTGFNVVNTYYKIDGGQEQAYSTSLTVSKPGEHTIEYWSVDNAGLQEIHNNRKFTIINHPPTAAANGAYSVKEGETIVLNGTGTDPDDDSLIYSWNLDNNSDFETTGQNPTFSAVDKDGPSVQTVELKVCDNYNACATNQAEITITNVAPTVNAITAPAVPVAINSPVNVSAEFTDPGPKDTHVAVWDFGDGTTANGTVTETNGSGNATGSHTYSQSGVYTITLTVTDKDSGSATNNYQYVVIYNPSGGFITASGHLDSPSGAYLSDPQKIGDIKFGINAKYKDNTPQGKTKINFKEANLDFESTSYEWYVINDNKAQLKGEGTINGTGEYTFLITLIDSGLPEGQRQDKIRIKITDSNGQVVYDSQPGDADTADPTVIITNGAIKIHQ